MKYKIITNVESVKASVKYLLLESRLFEDGALFFIGQRKGEPKRWVHCQDEQQKILKACHSDKLACCSTNLNKCHRNETICALFFVNYSTRSCVEILKDIT